MRFEICVYILVFYRQKEMAENISEQQFLELYDAHVGKIYRYIYFRVGSEEQAQDLTSEVFLRCWQYTSNQQSAISNQTLKNPRAFFYRVARNLITDFYRQKDKMPISLEEIADKSFADKLPINVADKFIADKSDGPAERAAMGLEMDMVKKALRCLNEDYREVIIWRYLDELEIKEIAEILDKREGTVRTLLSRALASLKEVLK
ncbi:MAG: RNA polymerase, sigma-24 subunit, ECF subfamily [Parcubacteria group bacterium GW2011_GWA2_43_9b]|uniref:RNA polymerase sigma factor 70 region 4 type 2 domain-containing protein n=1 Tax=Candidatus Portnoybacteria bacterium RIFCSPLOWO2_02_FULL_39_11 TaxID=1802001 RepID=A0A1G2FSG8_9BACT|nr:MAG: RNA polymerase, sigma-24 subunit, ECF subfamily [Parcubacteria group bacterium GW2011_GWA2_43_9b]OGZ40983.1 MAG: hypothetical protein A3B04_03375 [Candidatus Portnoybacteria bacterium RIFCSPLOWO2_02_FULL_39_11]